MRKFVGVVAGNMGEFKRFIVDKIGPDSQVTRESTWVVKIDGTTYFNVNSARQIRGFRNYELLYIGNFFERDDLDEIAQQDKANKMAVGK